MGSHFFSSGVVQQEGAEEGNWHKETSSCGSYDAPRTLWPKHSVVPIWGKSCCTVRQQPCIPLMPPALSPKKNPPVETFIHLSFFLRQSLLHP